MKQLNEHARQLFYDECVGLVENLNVLVPEDQPKLYIPDVTFGRKIGDYADKPYSVSGELLSAEAYTQHSQDVLPTAVDEAFLNDLMKDNDWIEPKKAGAEA